MKRCWRGLPAGLYKVLLAASLIVILSACRGGDGNGVSFSISSTLTTSVEYIGPNQNALPRDYFTKDIVLTFPYIPGAIFGRPGSDPLFVIRLVDEHEFSLDLASVVPILQENSSPLSEEWHELGLEIKPSATRLARVGTFAFDAKTGEALGAGGFIEAETKDYMILLYVDRSCQITGLFNNEGKTYLHDIQMPGTGFHWVRVKRLGNNTYRLELAKPSDEVRFSIQVFDLKPA